MKAESLFYWMDVSTKGQIISALQLNQLVHDIIATLLIALQKVISQT